jgi:hypothetical protein
MCGADLDDHRLLGSLLWLVHYCHMLVGQFFLEPKWPFIGAV